ncbi:MAG: sugar phosphate isomerase/epimerase [Clostridia bacterium]|nr:sugar phosphate isomerase/epimerase [Clostridia bacterium]
MYKVGCSCGRGISEETFQMLKASGIEAIELSLSHEALKTFDYKEVARLSKLYGIELWSFHLPFLPFAEIDISSTNEEIRRFSLDLCKEYIEKATEIGVDKFVIHPSAEPISPEERPQRLEASKKSLGELADFAQLYGAVIAVEDLPRTCLGNCADEMLEILETNDKLRVCFDTNHLLKDTNGNFLKKVGDKIITLHISDYDFVDEKHWLPGEGKIDWAEILEGLKNIGYNGVWMYEVGLGKPKTLTRSRNLNFDDFVKNAKAVFEGKEPERI